jgi:hypothetical protein
MTVTVIERPHDRAVDLVIHANQTDLALLTERYGRVVLDRLADRIVDDLMASAAVQARISAMRAELPTRIEQAVAAAITAAVLAPIAEKRS